MKLNLKKLKVAIIGLGYVGLPLALEFAKKRNIVGFDINKNRIEELIKGFDKNQEISNSEFKKKKIIFTGNKNNLKSINCFIITVPTPVNKLKVPDLKFLFNACETVGRFLKKGNIVIFESTVFPGCIEENCVPILERYSKIKFNRDFFCGYSPERVNPGDKLHTISNIKKITSGSQPSIANLIDKLYNEIVNVGTYKAPSIKIAEAAKVIENIQRDVNISLINELSIIFNKLNIDTKEVLDAAKTKWNFLNFQPGLVGGHCIGVDPYYLSYKAMKIGYKPRVILAGREINEKMGNHVALTLINEIKKKKIKSKNSKILLMGLTFKENCSDIRNSGAKKVFLSLKKFNYKLDLYDPLADEEDVFREYNTYPISKLTPNTYDAIIITVAHDKFKSMGIKKINKLCKEKKIIYDLKYLFSKDDVDLRL